MGASGNTTRCETDAAQHLVGSGLHDGSGRSLAGHRLPAPDADQHPAGGHRLQLGVAQWWPALDGDPLHSVEMTVEDPAHRTVSGRHPTHQVKLVCRRRSALADDGVEAQRTGGAQHRERFRREARRRVGVARGRTRGDLRERRVERERRRRRVGGRARAHTRAGSFSPCRRPCSATRPT
jgi:hypothetical protein